MGFPSSVALGINDRVSLARIPAGNTLPTAYVIDSDVAAVVGAASLTLSLTSVDGVAATATDSVELEHDSELFFASSNNLAASAVSAIGAYSINVDDAAGALPTNNVRVGDYITIGVQAQLYYVVERTANANDYTLRLFPELKAGVANDDAVVVYNSVRLNLPDEQQFITITDAGVAVPVANVTYPMAGPISSRDVYEMRQLLGVATVSPAPSVASEEIANMKFRTTLRGTTSFALTVDGQKFPGNAGFREVAYPYLVDTDRTNEGVYFEYLGNDGDRTRDTASITDSGGDAAVDAVKTYSLTITATRADQFETWTR